MPFYGQSFKLANRNSNGLNAKSFGGAAGGEFTKSEGFLSYYEVILISNVNLGICPIALSSVEFFISF